MKIYFAPMEGITSYIYRNAHHKYYGGIDKYYTPFLAPGRKAKISTREKREIDPANNEGTPVVPQILGNNSAIFIQMTHILADLGYEEVNFNLGCPSGTVVSRKRGSGFLLELESLDQFLDEVYQEFGTSGPKISIKTRLGVEAPEEFEQILEIYNKYPVHELTIHPRIQKDFYKKPVRPEWFEYGLKNSRNPVCYNGNIFTAQDYRGLCESCPDLQAVMVARGALVNPALPLEMLGNSDGGSFDLDTFMAFHQEICEGYLSWQNGEKNVLFKMKELWSYQGEMFPNGKKMLKKIKKSQTLDDYNLAVKELVKSL